METIYFDQIPSTQLWLSKEIRQGRLEPPVAVLADMQTEGIGSRKNSWIGVRGNFFASIALLEHSLPDDLPPQSASIYFAWLMREIISEFDSRVWLKWPNDLYLEDKKLAGVITTRLRSCYIVGIGVNLKRSKDEFASLDMELSASKLLELYLSRLEHPPLWKDIFRKFRLEFKRMRQAKAHINGEYMSLKDARLLNDGSIEIMGERIWGVR